MAVSGAIPEGNDEKKQSASVSDEKKTAISTTEVELKDPMTLTEYWEEVLKLLGRMESKYGPPDASSDEGYKAAMKAIKAIAEAGRGLEKASLFGLKSIDNAITAARNELKGEDQTPLVTGEASLALVEGYLRLVQHFANKKVKVADDANQKGLIQGGLDKPAWGKDKAGYQDASDGAAAMNEAVKKYKERIAREGAPAKTPQEQIKEAHAGIEKKHEQVVAVSRAIDKDYHVYHDITQALRVIKNKKPGLQLMEPSGADPEALHAVTDAFLKSGELKKMRKEVKGNEGVANLKENLRAEIEESLRFLYDEDYPPQSSESVYRKLLERDAKLVAEYQAKDEYKSFSERKLRLELEEKGLLLISFASQQQWNNRLANAPRNDPTSYFGGTEGFHRRELAKILASELAPRVKNMNDQLGVLDASHTQDEIVVIRIQQEKLAKIEEARRKKEEAERIARETHTPVVEEKIEVKAASSPEKIAADKAIASVRAGVQAINQGLAKYRAINNLLGNKIRAKGKELKAPETLADSKTEDLRKALDDFSIQAEYLALDVEMASYKGVKGAKKLRNGIGLALQSISSGEDQMPLTASEVYDNLKRNELISHKGQKKWESRLRDASKANLKSYAGGTEGFHRSVLADILADELLPSIEIVNERFAAMRGIKEVEATEVEKMREELQTATDHLRVVALEIDENWMVAVKGEQVALDKFLALNEHDLDIINVTRQLLEDLRDLVPEFAVFNIPKQATVSEIRDKIESAAEKDKTKLMREFVYHAARDEVERILQMENRTDQHAALRAIAKVIAHANEAIRSPSESAKVAKLKEAIQEIAGKPNIGWKFVGALMIAAGTLTGNKSLIAKGWASFESGYQYAKQGVVQLGAAFGWVASRAEKKKNKPTSHAASADKEEKELPAVKTGRSSRSGSAG